MAVKTTYNFDQMLSSAREAYAEELLRMAESVTEKEPEPSKPSGSVQVAAGTASGGSETEKQEN